jgi:hypothetical protein
VLGVFDVIAFVRAEIVQSDLGWEDDGSSVTSRYTSRDSVS